MADWQMGALGVALGIPFAVGIGFLTAWAIARRG